LQSTELIMARQFDSKTSRRIASDLHRNSSTISHELKCGTGCQIGANHQPFKTYFADNAQLIYDNHRMACRAVS
jgi:IS30 family transposase